MATDLKKLCLLVYTEIRNALCELSANYEGRQSVAMTSVRIRIGEPKSADVTPPAGDPGVYIPPELGWMVDLTFDPKSAIAEGKIDGGTLQETVIDLGTAAGLFDAYPVDTIQGVGPVWRRHLGKAGITTIGTLASLDRKPLIALCNRLHSHRPLEFFSKAIITRSELPLMEGFRKSPVTILALATMTPDEVRAKTTTELPDNLAACLIDYACLMVAVLRDDILAKTKLGDLVANRSA